MRHKRLHPFYLIAADIILFKFLMKICDIAYEQLEQYRLLHPYTFKVGMGIQASFGISYIIGSVLLVKKLAIKKTTAAAISFESFLYCLSSGSRQQIQ